MYLLPLLFWCKELSMDRDMQTFSPANISNGMVLLADQVVESLNVYFHLLVER